MSNAVSLSSIVVATKEQVAADLGAEAVILNLKSGVYYGLNEVGARIWHLLQQPRSVSDIQDTVREEYEVDPGRAEHDLLVLLQELAAARLIEVEDGPAT